MDRNYGRARRAARRRRAIRNRIIFGLIIAILIALIILLCKLIFGNENDTGQSQVPSTTDAATQAQTTAAAGQTDLEAPVISGAPSEINVEVGGTVSYKSGITVTDNLDQNPTLEIDNSAVDLSKAGSYKVIYTAKDASGNTSSIEVMVNVKEKQTEAEASAADVSQMKYLAGLYLKQIVKDGMSDYEKAQRIWLWVNWNCDYVSTSDKSNWVKGAIQYFETHKGDCFNYYCAAKALLEAAGIETVDVVKSDTSHSQHFWSLVNLGDGWYHFDTTPRDGGGDYFFLVTDEQLDNYSVANGNSHTFDHSAYPERATKVITDINDQPSYYSFFKE